ncbi:stage II sporulation protein D [Virgibacillus sp. MG-45]|uniref:stage II sporulation protein D n=1 Tax=Virgibacillus sp. MG-45 TaxID=3102791 RepID=UPI002ED92249
MKIRNNVTAKKWKQRTASKGNKKKPYTTQKRKITSSKLKSKFVSGNEGTSWKLPGILGVAFLFSVILVIPTLIVTPFVSENNKVTTVNDQSEKEGIVTLPNNSAVSVTVMRSESEEIEKVPLETYVARVVASEMPADFEMEALKAQVLAARTFIVYRMIHQNDNPDAFVTDTVSDQVYSSEMDLRKKWKNEYNEKMSKINQAVVDTEGEILTYENAPIFPAFFSTSNGYTENSEDYWQNKLPYLRSVKSPWDKKSPKYLDQKTFTIDEVEGVLQTNLSQLNNKSIQISRTEGKRVKEVTLGDKSFTGRDIREKLKLQSSDFSIEQKSNHLVFTTKGYGHGIGMSQYGANGMAKEGKTYKEILSYYFQGVEISTVNETAPALVVK